MGTILGDSKESDWTKLRPLDWVSILATPVILLCLAFSAFHNPKPFVDSATTGVVIFILLNKWNGR